MLITICNYCGQQGDFVCEGNGCHRCQQGYMILKEIE